MDNREERNMGTLLISLLLTFSSFSASDGSGVKAKVLCAYSNSGFVQNGISEFSEPAQSGRIMPDNKTVECPQSAGDSGAGCFTVWNGSAIFRQDCWSCDPKDCTSQCINKDTRSSQLSFCSCIGHLCNANFTDDYNASMNTPTKPPTHPESSYVPKASDSNKIIIIAILSVLSVASVIIVVFVVYRLCPLPRRRHLEVTTLVEEPPSQPSFQTDDLKLSSLISKGRYGEVWKGSLNDNDVAVKVFSHAQRQYFNNERDIYSLPLIHHPSVVHYFGTEERISVDGNPEYLLILSYASHGSLHSYLKNNVLDWYQLCNMSRSIAQGLSYLHTDLRPGDMFKPAIAHRDFNTRNILVKDDLTCCITDMGFATKIMGSKFIKNGQEEIAEQSSLNDVGTLRYMAPEVLDGAVNLRDCESSLKQIDVYSMGLVLWELLMRTKELFPGSVVPEYCLPFQAEVGLHPTIDEMQQLVSKNKQRPSLPRICHAVNSTQPQLQAIRALKETVEDCWDQDGEARLTAMCVEERMSEIASLWDMRHKGVTPTAINHTMSQPTVTTDVVISTTTNTIEEPERMVPLCRSMSDSDGAVLGQYTRLQPRQRESLSTVTVETILSPSTDGNDVVPAATVNANKKENVNLKYEMAQKAIQPHQGRNPTVERNTHRGSEEELAVFDNTLMDAKMAAKQQAERERQREQLVHEQEAEEQRDGSHRNMRGAEGGLAEPVNVFRNTPIPYVQNRVHEPSVAVVRPKVSNVPGNGSHHAEEESCYGKPQNTDKSKKHKDKRGIMGMLSKNLKSFGNHFHSGSLDDMTSSATHHYDVESGTGAKCSVAPEERRPLLTEVCVVNGSPVVRPATLAVNHIAVTGESKLGIAEVGVAKLQPAHQPDSLPFRVKERNNRAQSETDLSPSGAEKAVRPNSLRLRGHNYRSDPQLNRSDQNSMQCQERGQRGQKAVQNRGLRRLPVHGSSQSVESNSNNGLNRNRGGQHANSNSHGTEMNLLNVTEPAF